MQDDEARVYITKIASAQRQLDAAIRLYLAGEDELAVHTVGAAAFRIIRDLKQKRGRGQLADSMNLSLFAYADDLVSGRLQELPEFLIRDGLEATIKKIAEGMKRGEIKTYSDIQLPLNLASEGGHWKEFNKVANFLKHSDFDEAKLLSDTDLKNEILLAQACVAYKQLMGRFTPETFVFAQLFYVQDDYQPFRLSGIAAEIAAADPSERKNLCLQIIERIKGEAVEG